MKKRNTLQSTTVLLVLILLSAGCEKSNDSEQDIIIKEVKASLDGEIVYCDNNHKIYKSNSKLGGKGILIGSEAYDGIETKWSPDGSRIAYVRSAVLENNVYLVILSKDGVKQHELLLGAFYLLASLRAITWSPDGNTVATLAGNKIIYTDVNTGKLTTTQLYPKSGFTFWSIAWWPKGNKIAIAEGREGLLYSDDGNQYIWMFEAYENNPYKNPNNLLVTNSDPSILSIAFLDWCMDGSKLAYSDSGTGDIYIVNSDGTGNQKIIAKHPFENEHVYGFAPCWMSNNKQIIFVGVTGVSGSTLNLGLFVTDISGSYNIDLNIAGLYPDCN
jgi:Tol biopolymer transport system component